MTDHVLSQLGDVANIVIAVASVATAIVTAIVLCKQHKLQKQQHALEKEKLNAHQLEHQPKFQFCRSYSQYTISNEGAELSAPIRVSIHSMITVQSDKLVNDEPMDCIYCHPIIYYKQRAISGKLKGELASFLFNAEDWRVIQEKITTLHARLNDIENYPEDSFMTILSVRISDVVRIHYFDMYNIERTIYFWDAERISEERYRQLIRISHSVPVGLYDPQNISVETIVRNVHQTTYELKA